jgi:AmiR/NasT family two-component response regulator
MPFPQNYVLILDEQYQWFPHTESTLSTTQLPICVASSTEQAVAQVQRMAPCLVILVGDDQSWVRAQVHTLRQATQSQPATILALTESTQPNWEPHENTPDLDGFLVKPLTLDVLHSLIQSALVKQSYRSPFNGSAPNLGTGHTLGDGPSAVSPGSRPEHRQLG